MTGLAASTPKVGKSGPRRVVVRAVKDSQAIGKESEAGVVETLVKLHVAAPTVSQRMVATCLLVVVAVGEGEEREGERD